MADRPMDPGAAEDEAFDEGYTMAIDHAISICEFRRDVFGGEPTTTNEKQIVDHIIAALRKRRPDKEDERK